jgi:hypothetical protein
MAEFPLKFRLKESPRPEDEGQVDSSERNKLSFEQDQIALQDRLASGNISDIGDSQSPSNDQWRQRLSRDMSYLWEISEKPDYPANIDWREVYQRLWKLSHLKRWNRYRWREHLEGNGYVSIQSLNTAF